jgi:N-methylhydantoinase A
LTAASALRTEGFADDDHVFVRTADVRYFGQAFEVRVPVPDGPVTDDVLTAVADRFHAEHRALYGYDFAGDPSQQVEVVNLRVSGVGPIKRPAILRAAPDRPAPRPTGSRSVCFDTEAGYVDTPVYWRPDLPAGHVVTGPVIIEEFGSTVPIHPGFTARVDDHANIVVTRSNS